MVSRAQHELLGVTHVESSLEHQHKGCHVKHSRITSKACVATALVVLGMTALGVVGATPAAAAAKSNTGQVLGVSCTSTTFCMAVGASNGTLTESWNGSVWSVVPSPSPSSSYNAFESVSCVSATDCVAVGGSNDSEGVTQSLAEVWNGTSWSVVSTPTLSGDQIQFNSVSCVDSSSIYCVAVGSVAGAASEFPSQTLAESWNGTTWTMMSTPIPLYNENSFRSVSCTSSSSCLAVGGTVECVAVSGVDSCPSSQMLVELWNGTSWSIDTTPDENGSDTLLGVSCTSSSSCVGIGTSTNSSTGVTEGLVDSWNGTSWTVSFGPTLATSPDQAYPAGVSCVSATDCMAVGPTQNLPETQTLALSWDGAALSVVPSANPSSTYDFFDGVSCVNSKFCAAVGEQMLPPSEEPLFEMWNGSTWSTPPPTTSVLVPSKGSTVDGSIWLDAGASSQFGIASVSYEVSGGSVSDKVVSSSVATSFGWLGAWDTSDVPNGTYTLQSVATDTLGNSATGAGITVIVDNLPLQTAVLVPSNGATLSGSSAVLDASASGVSDVTGVQFVVSGGSITDEVVGTADPTLYGWIARWDTTKVPNGSYTLHSVATEVGGTMATSTGTTVTVKNAA